MIKVETNFKELLNNTNLTIAELLNYYKEEIWKQYEIYRALHNEILNDKYEIYINKEQQQEQIRKIKNLIEEFLNFTKYISLTMKKHSRITIRLYNTKILNCMYYPQKLLSNEGRIKDFIKSIIDIIYKYYNITKVKETKNEEQKNINDYYIEELNRIIDEQETKISDLEAVIFQDKQNINDLINEKIELKLAKVLGDKNEN